MRTTSRLPLNPMQVLRYIRHNRKAKEGAKMANTFARLAQFKEEHLMTDEKFVKVIDDPTQHHKPLLLKCDLDPEMNVSE